MNIPEISAFLGKDFDFESGLPRLFKRQVLKNWSWVPEGFAWEACYQYEGDARATVVRANSKAFIALSKNKCLNIYWAACIGIDAQLRFNEWAKANDIPLVDVQAVDGMEEIPFY